MTEEYKPSIEEIRAHAEASDQKSKARRDAEAKKKNDFKKNIKTAAVLGTAALLTATAIKTGMVKGGPGESEMPDDRFTPERTATQYPETVDEIRLTPEQIAEKHAQDEEAIAKERELIEKGLQSDETTPPAPDETGEETKGFR